MLPDRGGGRHAGLADNPAISDEEIAALGSVEGRGRPHLHAGRAAVAGEVFADDPDQRSGASRSSEGAKGKASGSNPQ